MAVPKVCGIENEFGFVILDQAGKQTDEFYREISVRFVKNALMQYEAARYNRSKETPSESVWKTNKPDITAIADEEVSHRRRLKFLSWKSDGFLLNGARFYLDDTHPEYCTPECLLPLDAVAHDKASEIFLMQAQQSFAQNTLEGRIGKYRILVHKNNSDGFGKSYGCHLNVLLSYDLVASERSLRYLVKNYVPFQIARLVLIGGGKVGAENRRPDCRFQISQRADFFETLVGVGTTSHRPIFNTRNEPHADFRKFFRLHDISTDSLMCEHAIFLKVALTQVVLAMIEDRYLTENWFPKNSIEAIQIVSRDLKFQNPIILQNGKKITGLELLRKYLLRARQYLNENPLTSQHDLAVNYALKLLLQLEKDPFLTVGKLDWTTAWRIVEANPAQLAISKVLEFREVSLDGTYYRLRKSGKIPSLLKDSIIAQAMVKAPENTRAHLRSLLLKKHKGVIWHMDWSSMILKDKSGNLRTIKLENPLLDKEYYRDLLLELES